MWLIDDTVFANARSRLDTARRRLQRAAKDKTLTVLIGNSPSRSALFLKALKEGNQAALVGWHKVVTNAAARLGKIKRYTKDRDANLIALAQAVVNEEGANGRANLLRDIRKEFRRPVDPTLIHRMIVDIGVRHVVTTNYDLQIERAYSEKGKDWRATVRNAQFAGEDSYSGVLIHKLHGSIQPDADTVANYTRVDATNAPWANTIVISEKDYDACLQELMDANDQERAGTVLDALKRPLLIIGKAIEWEDLSFLYSLRATRGERPFAYCISMSPSTAEELNLLNLGIECLNIEMPADARDLHYYAAICRGLVDLFGGRMRKYRDYRAEVNRFISQYRLTDAPRFVAVGLVSHNIVGSVSQQTGATAGSQLPEPGSRTFAYDAEESPGGRALTAAATVAALDNADDYPVSLIGVVGRNDPFAGSIKDFCRDWGINRDGLCDQGDRTWQSTVLVHQVETENWGTLYGQRVFLDRGVKRFGPKRLEQLKGQLSNADLICFDDITVRVHPGKKKTSFLDDNELLLDECLRRRPRPEVVYDLRYVSDKREHEFVRKYANIVICPWSFFAHRVLLHDGSTPARRCAGRSWLLPYVQKGVTRDVAFGQERYAIEAFLNEWNQNKSTKTIRGGTKRCELKAHEVQQMKRFVRGRGTARRWFVVTLHDRGAIGFDLATKEGFHAEEVVRYVRNTAGAGSAFRGGFCYGLLRLMDRPQRKRLKSFTELTTCVRFGVKTAAERCSVFNTQSALNKLKDSGATWWNEMRLPGQS